MSAYIEKLDRDESVVILNGVDFTSDQEQLVNAYPVNLVARYTSGDIICVFVEGLQGVTDYVPATSGSVLGQRNRICMQAFYDSSKGIYEFNCGTWDYPSSIVDIDPNLLPAGCNCASVSSGSC